MMPFETVSKTLEPEMLTAITFLVTEFTFTVNEVNAGTMFARARL